MQASHLDVMLACPRCHAPFEVPDPATSPACAACGASYRWDAGALDLTPVPPPPGLVADRWELWEQLQRNGAVAYDAAPAANLSVGDRLDARLFGEFAELSGRVLDVGCGPQARPSYVPDLPGVDLIGIDPLRGASARDFAFVRGLGEYLPFAPGTFDRVLFGTSLDHLLDPERALREAARVLAPGGRVVVWCGLLQQPLLMRPLLAVVRAASALRRGRTATPPTPQGAIDAYHFEHPEPDRIEAWIVAAGLRVIARRRLKRPSSSVFLQAVRG